jgi:hypothetical protein
MADHCKAWTDSTLSSIWSPPLPGTTKANFDVALSSDFAVATIVVSDFNGNIIGAATKKILTKDVALGEAQAALLAVHIAASCDVYSLILALNVVLAIQQPQLFEGCNFSNDVSNISLYFHSFYSWKAEKVYRSANFRAYCLAKWAASHLVFGSILIGLSILSSIRNRSGKDHPL